VVDGGALQRREERDQREVLAHCGHLINLPDVTQAHTNFTIVGERIQAPLSLLHGVGETAHNELVAGAPFTSIRDVVDKIEAKKLPAPPRCWPRRRSRRRCDVDGLIITVEKEQEVEKTVKGRSALNSGIVYKLIVSGAMDEPVPRRHDHAGDDGGVRARGLGARERGPRRPQAQAEEAEEGAGAGQAEYVNLTQYSRYQLRKGILPAYSESVLRWPSSASTTPSSTTGSGSTRAGPAGPLRRRQGLRAPEHVQPAVRRLRHPRRHRRLRRGRARIPVRRPQGEEGRRRHHRPRRGTGVKFVRWPDRETGKLDDDVSRTCSTAASRAPSPFWSSHKFKDGKPFTIDHIEILQRPLGAAEESPEPEESP
jgi:hypothetical protein